MRLVSMVAAMGLLTVNVWTGAPLLALWIGARVVGQQGQISMLAVAVVVLSMLTFCLILVRALGLLGARYDEITGKRGTVHRHAPWLRSMRGERSHGTPGVDPRLSTMEYVVVTVVIVAWIAFEIWFFFYSSSPIDGRSGREGGR